MKAPHFLWGLFFETQAYKACTKDEVIHTIKSMPLSDINPLNPFHTYAINLQHDYFRETQGIQRFQVF